MSPLDAAWNRRIPAAWFVALAVLLALAVIVIAWRATSRPTAAGSSSPVSADDISAALPIASPLVSSLGALEGPYSLEKASQPKILMLRREGAADAEPFELLGIRNGKYPVVAADDPDKLLTEAERREALLEFARFKMQALEKLLAGRPLWLIRLGASVPGQPTIAYIFAARAGAPADAPPTGDLELVNALAPRLGIANLEIDYPDHPLREIMVDCQLASLAEARQAAADPAQAPDIWTRFRLRFPPGPDDARLAAIEASLR